ncbi:MAG: nitroreductase family protein [Faecalibacillus sp.]
MNAIELLKTRRSCRSFQKEMIKDEELQTILECGLNAPSAMNKQDSKIVVVQDEQLVKELSRLNAKVMGKDIDPFYGAPMVCLILVPQNNRNGDKDGALVIGAMQDAAYALNIGSCWINRCQEMLELEEGKDYLKKWQLEGYRGVGCCILGYPDQQLPEKTIHEGRVIKVSC